MLSRFSALSTLLILTACGAVADESPGPGPTDPSTSTSDPKKSDPCSSCTIEGSYEVTFQSVARADGKTSSGVPLADTRASISNRARIDLGKPSADGTVDVLLTGRWNESARFTGKIANGKLTLAGGKATFGTGDEPSSFNESNTWTELELPLDASGRLVGTFAAKGELFASAGDVVDSFPIAGSGILSADRRAPAIRLEPPPRSRGGQWLPWDPIWIRFAEPLRRDALAPMLATVPEVAWPPVGDASAKADDPIASLYGWATAFTTNGQTRALASPAGVVDPSSNALTPFSASLTFRDVGAAKARHELDAGFASWGTVEITKDGRCESLACAVFPAEDQTRCDTPSGIAGRLATGGTFTTVHARVRVLAGSAMTDGKPYVIEPLRFQVVSGADLQQRSLAVDLVKDGAGETPWTSAWTTIDVPITGTEAGFSFVRTTCDTQGGLPLPEAKVSVIVDAVWAD